MNRQIVFILLALFSASLGGVSPLDSSAHMVKVYPASTVLLPFVSVIIPGFGQLVQQRYAPGIAYAGSATSGLILFAEAKTENGKQGGLEDALLDKRGTRQQIYGLGILYQGAGFFSAWDVFQASIPTLQQDQGRFKFMGNAPREKFSDLVLAPFLPKFFLKPTTWIPLLALGGYAYYEVQDYRDSLNKSQPDTRWLSMNGSDIFFSGAVSMNAGASEEAFFRGYMYPLFYQWLNERDWIANPVQALLFAAGHLSNTPYPIVQGLLGAYLAYLTRRNQWTVGQSVCIHFWWDVIAFSAAMATRLQIPLSIGISNIPFSL